jgi:hypothetical protein
VLLQSGKTGVVLLVGGGLNGEGDHPDTQQRPTKCGSGEAGLSRDRGAAQALRCAQLGHTMMLIPGDSIEYRRSAIRGPYVHTQMEGAGRRHENLTGVWPNCHMGKRYAGRPVEEVSASTEIRGFHEETI